MVIWVDKQGADMDIDHEEDALAYYGDSPLLSVQGSDILHLSTMNTLRKMFERGYMVLPVDVEMELITFDNPEPFPALAKHAYND